MEPIKTKDLIQLLTHDQWQQQFSQGQALPPELEQLRTLVSEQPELLDDMVWQSDLDRQLLDVFDEVDVPVELVGRLIAAIDESELVTASSALTKELDANLVVPRMAIATDVDDPPLSSQPHRRGLVWALLGTAACLVFAVVLSPFWNGPPVEQRLTYAGLEEMLPVWVAELELTHGWDHRLADAPYATSIVETQVQGKVISWRTIGASDDCIAMNLSSPRNGKLWVLILPAGELERVGKFKKMQLSGKFAAGSWSDGKHLFIAISDESMKKIGRIFRKPLAV
ncbi:MAG: hypothetical protein HN617_06790 [Planctomycetaceae bacterium]|jgi:hypothetical protein|nr:hypothetical protein [Planctomycetaceae bacterium]MBT4012530.1 hypothetical protein [Planctomycetaceae bacterium]MBT4723630.1 hypothetical protein [Planctomycetaceae bacterium]MBT4845141.1 hypothetical protein [Planctomycetaceae bacterium]MBT5125335.1 hypothetical protein [Planctomycetaceae bacterium]